MVIECLQMCISKRNVEDEDHGGHIVRISLEHLLLIYPGENGETLCYICVHGAFPMVKEFLVRVGCVFCGKN